MNSLFDAARGVIMEADPARKVTATREVEAAWHRGKAQLCTGESAVVIDEPGRPERPLLVRPESVPRRSLATPEGHGALLHAIVHIEFNAINLAWDAVYRFREMPREYYSDWIRVAAEEAHHFELLSRRLSELGFRYGSFSAHNGLWDMARQTDYDVMVRMALVPRVLEARGLDATPRIVRRLREIGDLRSVAILEDVIFRDEIGHVQIGSHWFRYCCRLRGLDPVAVFTDLVGRFMKGRLRGPLHDEARRQAGFTEAEMRALNALAGGGA